VPDQFTGEIEVTADVPVVDTSQVNTGVVWDDGYLQLSAVGSENRDYQSILRQAAGVTGGPGSNPQVFGGTYGENSYLIDGMNTTDPSFGTWGTTFNLDAVQEMSFQTGGFEAEFGQATGGIVNLVTKSGGNQFSGSFDARYRDQSFNENGDHFDRDRQSSSNRQISVALGGPVLKDRLWFFTSLQYIDSSQQGTFATFPYDWEGFQFLGKITWQVTGGNRLIVKYSTDPAEIPGVNSGRTVEPSARETQEQGGDFWQLEVNSVLSPRWLLVAQLGVNDIYTRGFPTDNPESLSGHWNEDTDFNYNSSGWVWDWPRERNEARVNATWFVDDLAGAHELKGGLEYNEVRSEELTYRTGGGSLTDHVPSAVGWDPLDLNGDGYFNYFVSIREPEERVREPRMSTADIATVFLQDAWRPHPRLTIKPGIRLDNVVPTNHAGEKVADMSRWQPRLGVAWDITGSSRHVVRATAGRFMDPTSLIIPWFASGTEGLVDHEYNTLEYYCNLSRGLWCDADSLPASFGEPIPWTNWAGQRYTLIDNRGIPYADTARTVDQEGLGRLRAPYADELILAYETQLADDTSLELSYVRKKSEDLIEDTCSGNAWAWGDAPLPTLDDPQSWTRAADCGSWLVVNMPGAERLYDGLILRAETRRAWGHLMASYTYSDSRGTNYSGPQWYAYGFGDYFPVSFYNMEGKFEQHRWHRIKLNGYVLLPGRFTVGLDAFFSSPGHQTVSSSCSAFQSASSKRSTADQMAALGIDPATLAYCSTPDGLSLSDYWINHWPRGSLELKSVWQADVQLSKSFRAGRTDITAILSVFNLFNQEWDATFNSTAFLQATEEDPETGESIPLHYQDDDPNGPYYDEYYGADSSPVLTPIGAATSYWDPRRYEIGLRIEF
jgi:hypothetical protein